MLWYDESPTGSVWFINFGFIDKMHCARNQEYACYFTFTLLYLMLLHTKQRAEVVSRTMVMEFYVFCPKEVRQKEY